MQRFLSPSLFLCGVSIARRLPRPPARTGPPARPVEGRGRTGAPGAGVASDIRSLLGRAWELCASSNGRLKTTASDCVCRQGADVAR
jgi:hypothetical protein